MKLRIYLLQSFILSICLVLALIFSFTKSSVTVAAEEVSLKPTILSYIEVNNEEELNRLIEDCELRKDAAHDIAEGARALGYPEEHPVIILAKEEWHNADNIVMQYRKQLEEIKSTWDAKLKEYPEATIVWLYLKNLGYNNYVCAGIMGNLMAETGGHTFELTTDLYGCGGLYYGICQWSKTYYPQVHGTSLEFQCDFLRDTIKYEMDTFGRAYKKGFDYEDFLNIEDEKVAAIAFAKTYERCSSSTYSARKKNAVTAYKYFVER